MGTFKRRFSRRPLALTQETAETWLVRSRPPVNRQEAKPQGSSWPPRLPGSLRHPPEGSRSPIGTGPAQSLSVRSGVTRSPPSCSSASCPSRGWSGRLLKISRLICGSSPPPSAPCRRPARPTWLVCLRTPTCAPSTPSVSPSCPRTSSWPGGSVESVHKKDQFRLDLAVTDHPRYTLWTISDSSPRLCSLKFSNPCALTFLSISTSLHS